MAERESLKKLKISSLRNLHTEHGIHICKKKKDLIQELLLCQTPTSVLTSIIQQSSAEVSLNLPFEESLPPFHAVTYDCLDQSHIPTLTFSDIYSFIIERPTSHGIAVKNFKGLNKSIKHFEAGDVQDIRVSEVEFLITFCIL